MSVTETTSKIYRSLPPQKVGHRTKYSKNWQHNCVDSIIGMASARGDNGRSPRDNKRINYDIVNSRFKQSDFDYVLNPYGMDDSKFQGSATKMQGYNIIRQKLETLKGEEMKMGLNFRAVAVNGEAVSQKNKEKNEAITEAIKAKAMAIVSGKVDPNTPDPAKVAESFRTAYSNPTEIASNKLLKYLTLKDQIPMKFSKGWEHALISSEEIYHMSIRRGHPHVRVCNPLNVEFDREVESPFVHEGDWAMEERWMPVGSVIDLYGDSMSDDLIKRLDRGELGGNSVQSNGMVRDFAYDFDGGMRMDSGMSQNTSHVYVANVCWRSFKKIGHLKYLDPRTGMVESTTVDESFRLTPELKEQGAQVTWDWITEIWEGVRIGQCDFIDVQPVSNQTGNLPYVGYIYNNVNSVATSLVDMVKAHQYTYIIVWYRLEQELAKAKGKKFVMDVAQLPKSKGWTVDQWMYYFDNLGVAWINSMEEGRKNDPTSISKFNQFQSIDMSLSQVVGQYMAILEKLEQQVENITGVTPQREGNIGSSETATGAQRAIIQSTNNTKPLFYYHDLVRQTVLQEVVELCKVAYIDGAEIEYALDEQTVESIKIDSGMLNGTDLGVFITNSFEEAETKEKLERYLEVALQTDKANLSDIVSVLGTKSTSEIRNKLVEGEQEKQQRDAKAQEQQLETQERINQANLEDKQAERELKLYDIDTKSETALLVAEIKEQSSDETNEELVRRKQSLDERKQAFTEQSKNRELSQKDRALRESERSNKAKEKITKDKPEAGKAK